MLLKKAIYPQTGHTELLSTINRTYNENSNNYAETITSYQYNSINFQPKSITNTNSKGYTIENKIYYPEDYTFGGVIADMASANMVTIPISTETWQKKSINSIPELVSTSITEFGTAPNGDYKPIRSYSLQTDKPVPQSTIGVFDATRLVRNPVGQALIFPATEISYNAKGNPTTIKDLLGNRNSAVIYGYSNTLPVANITNALSTEVAYTSFEGATADLSVTTNQGNWAFSNTNVVSGFSPTGNQCYLLANAPVSVNNNSGININKDYKLSLWATASVSVNGITPSVTGPTINSWTYYEFNIPSGASLPVISGNGFIDELRLYPKNAGMITTSYEVGVGKSSECDINNRINYYQYDGLGRLSLVYDENHNITKKICYNFSGEVENCTTPVYCNDHFGAYMYRGDCVAPQVSNGHWVEIPACTYTSTISLAHANSLAYAFAKQQGMQWTTCFTPIYARFEFEPNRLDEYSNENEVFSSQVVDVWVRFYSDAACTQSLTLTQNMNISFSVTTTTEYPSSFVTQVGSDSQLCLAGTNEINLGECGLFGHWDVLDENAQVTYFERWGSSYSFLPYNNFLSAGYIANNIIFPPWY
jgi:hypothetical protein